MNDYTRKILKTEFPFDYLYEEGNEKKLFILLHGYGEHAKTAWDFSYELIKKNFPQASILAPCGPFPIPKITETGHIKKHAWYFFDRSTSQYFIDYNFPSSLVASLVQQLGHEDSEITIIGYSQGGYLAPFVAQKLKETKEVIGLACVFKHEFMEKDPRFTLHSIHAKEDLMVEYKNAKKSFDVLKSLGNRGRFITIENEGHRLNDKFKNELEDLLKNEH